MPSNMLEQLVVAKPYIGSRIIGRRMYYNIEEADDPLGETVGQCSRLTVTLVTEGLV
jgi:hypothetical protein